eukprot:12905602-Prorocentrum_lima.AAC.1
MGKGILGQLDKSGFLMLQERRELGVCSVPARSDLRHSAQSGHGGVDVGLEGRVERGLRELAAQFRQLAR